VDDGSNPLIAFYDRSYSGAGHSRWRELSARGKADHVEDLCRRVGLEPRTVVEIGCGDGALLAELARRGVGDELHGFDISSVAIDQARRRGVAQVDVFDGVTLPDHRWDLAVLSHVLEHVEDPLALLVEAARHAPWLIVEVPLEANVSARRASKREGAGEIGHVQRFDRSAVTSLARSAGLRVEAELLDPLPRAVHVFAGARVRGSIKAAARRAVFAASPRLAERLFTLHYAYAASSSDT